jgi:hypothetical protein
MKTALQLTRNEILAKKLIAPWTFVGQRKHAEHSIEQIREWMGMIFEESWKDAGPSAKRESRTDDLGPLKRKHVRDCYALLFVHMLSV